MTEPTPQPRGFPCDGCGELCAKGELEVLMVTLYDITFIARVCGECRREWKRQRAAGRRSE